MEELLILAFYFNSNAENGKVCVRAKLLSVRQPSSGKAGGLYEGLMRGLDRGNVKDSLVAFGCNGASVNLASNGVMV